MSTFQSKYRKLFIGVPLIILGLLFLAVLLHFLSARLFLFATSDKTAKIDTGDINRGLPLPQQPSAESKATSPSWDTAWATLTPRMIISRASLKLEVANTRRVADRVAAIAHSTGGFVTQSSINNYDNSEYASITIRVPAKHYSTAVSEIAKLGRVILRDERGEDITEEYIDVESRLRNLRREEEAFLRVLARANKITDILAIERELSRVRGEIEQATGRIKYLQNQVALATISVELTQPTPAVKKIVVWDIGRTAQGAFNGLKVVFRIILSLIIWLIIFIPFWILLWLMVLIIRRWRRRRVSQES